MTSTSLTIAMRLLTSAFPSLRVLVAALAAYQLLGNSCVFPLHSFCPPNALLGGVRCHASVVMGCVMSFICITFAR